MVNYIVGDIINAIADVSLGIGRSVAEYEWKWDDSIIGESIDTISYDTTNDIEGNHTLSLRILNDCGNWSGVDVETLTLVMPSGNVDIDSTSYIQGDNMRITWSNVTVVGTKIIIFNPIPEIVRSWVINDLNGSIDYLLPSDAIEGKYFVYLAYINKIIDYKTFTMGSCPIPSVNIVLQ